MTFDSFRAIPKRCISANVPPPYAVELSCTEDLKQHYSGDFNGFNVTINNEDQTIALYSKGFFGKGFFSQGYPTYAKRRLKRLKERKSKVKDVHPPDVTAGTEDKFTDSSIVEQLHLSLEEAFFLSFSLKCLTIKQKNRMLSYDDMWKLFQEVYPFFIEKYVTYHHFRKKGWVVKPGLKYGGDYLLYKNGPPYYHASFVVIILSNANEEMKNKTVDDFLALNRAIEAAHKDLLLCKIILPENINKNLDLLDKCCLSEYLFRRWTCSK